MRSRTPDGLHTLAPARGLTFGSIMGSGRERVSVWRWLLWSSVLLGVLSTVGCASMSSGSSAAGNSDEPLPVAMLETLNTLHLSANRGQEGLATDVRVELSIEPKTLGVFKIVGRGDEGGPVDDALVQLTIAWKDFAGLSPTSFGGRQSRPTVFGDGGAASRGAPFTRAFELSLNPPQLGVLARRVDVTARFHPVDVISEVARSAGARMDFPKTTLETLLRSPEGTLDEWFGEGSERDPAELFLCAAATPTEQRAAVIDRLVASLASLTSAERGAAFGALHFLTGVTNGQSVYAWEAWIRQQPITGTSER